MADLKESGIAVLTGLAIGIGSTVGVQELADNDKLDTKTITADSAVVLVYDTSKTIRTDKYGIDSLVAEKEKTEKIIDEKNPEKTKDTTIIIPAHVERNVYRRELDNDSLRVVLPGGAYTLIEIFDNPGKEKYVDTWVHLPSSELLGDSLCMQYRTKATPVTQSISVKKEK